ncbi:hypothetical protein HAX54_051321 [Datura stramonium]|uniref:RRM domain-containing protein n=1 Tax=Datura stramonium TaxID=4076 RepID=A0ABS8SXJ9_DATST|nr:hypothetical protein [Datura stramonium]
MFEMIHNQKHFTLIPIGCCCHNFRRSVLLIHLDDHCLFCGDLGNEVNDDVLSKAFSRFPTFNMAKVKRDKWTGKTKGYGFASFSNPLDLAAALKRMNELDIVGLEVCWKSASKWQERNDDEALESDKQDARAAINIPGTTSGVCGGRSANRLYHSLV